MNNFGRSDVMCSNCGEEMVGDGFSLVYHCPYTYKDLSLYEPDSNPIHCNERDQRQAEAGFVDSYLN